MKTTLYIRSLACGAVAVLLSVVCPMATSAQKVTNASIQKLQKEQAALQNKISESEKLLKSTKKDVQAQLSNLMVLNSQIGEKKKYVSGIQQQVDTMKREIANLEKELGQLQYELDQCKAKFQKGALYMYRNKMMQNKLMFIFSAKNFRQMYRRMRYMLEYAKYQRAQGIIIKAKEDAVKRKREQVIQAKALKEQLAAQGRAEQKLLEDKQVERQKVVDGLNKKSKQLQSAIATNKKKYANLNAQIDKLIQEEIRRQEAKRKAEEAKRKAEEEARRKAAASKSGSGKSGSKSSSKGPYTSGNSNSSSGFRAADEADRKLSANFVSNQGRLPVPITGPYTITGHYGQNAIQGLSGVTIPNNGTNYTGQAGAQARAVFDGEVTAVFAYGGMTNIIVRHGSYMSVYCNLSGTSVRRGQKVTTKQVLGPVARDASGNCTLQFQLRKETTKLNPESWIAR